MREALPLLAPVPERFVVLHGHQMRLLFARAHHDRHVVEL